MFIQFDLKDVYLQDICTVFVHVPDDSNLNLRDVEVTMTNWFADCYNTEGFEINKLLPFFRSKSEEDNLNWQFYLEEKGEDV